MDNTTDTASQAESAFGRAWRVIDMNGKSYGIFPDHDKANDFANALLVRLELDAIRVCREVVPSGHAIDHLVWTGDNIGLGGGEDPVLIGLMDSTGRRQFVSLEQALAVAERIDPSSGYQRLEEALPFAAAQGDLCPADLAVWRGAAHRIAALLVASADYFDVTYWLIGEDHVNERGLRARGVPLSQKFATRQAADEALVEIKARKPDAYVVRHTICFHWSDPEDIAERNKLLDEIRRGESVTTHESAQQEAHHG